MTTTTRRDDDDEGDNDDLNAPAGRGGRMDHGVFSARI